MGTLSKAIQIFLLENPEGTLPTMEDLTITIPGTVVSTSPDGSSNLQTKDFIYRTGFAKSGGDYTTTPIISATRKRGSTSLYLIMQLPTAKPGSACSNTCCWFTADAESLCKNIGFTVADNQTCQSSSLGCYRMP